MVKKSKKPNILIFGLGQYPSGSGVSAALYFAKQDVDVTVTDLKDEAALSKTVKQLKKFPNVQFVLGKHRMKDIRSADVIIRNPGVPWHSKHLVYARKQGILIESDVTIFFRLCPAPILGVTGTRGKSTTSALLAEIMESSGKKVWLGGNIKMSPLSFLKKAKKDDIVVLELSSWMLESLADLGMSPQLGLITNILPDHLNTYSSMKDYARAKEYIFTFQSAQDIAVVSRDQDVTRKIGSRALARRYWWSLKPFSEENGGFLRGNKLVFREKGSEQVLATLNKWSLKGEHNRSNLVAAATAAMASGGTASGIKKAIANFKGLPDRLEEIRSLRGVTYINDTTATTPDALIAALESIGKKRTVLIAGGSDKQLPFTPIPKPIKKHVKNLVMLPGKGTDRMLQTLKRAKVKVPTVHEESMKKAVKRASSMAKKGDVILLSPGCASFGLFKNEFDRGDKFRDAVKKL